MGGLDAPGLGVEVVGTVADVFHRTEGEAFVGDGDDATRGIGGQHEGLATQVAKGIGVGEIDVRVLAFRQIRRQDFEFRVDSG